MALFVPGLALVDAGSGAGLEMGADGRIRAVTMHFPPLFPEDTDDVDEAIRNDTPGLWQTVAKHLKTIEDPAERRKAAVEIGRRAAERASTDLRSFLAKRRDGDTGAIVDADLIALVRLGVFPDTPRFRDYVTKVLNVIDA